MRRSLLVALLACCILAPVARADSDRERLPAHAARFRAAGRRRSRSDAKQLTQTIADAKKRGYEIRVAVIGTPYDLGSVGALFKKPKEYARFLGTELFFVYKGRLLVVMPNGYGVSQGGKKQPAGQAVVDRLPPPGNGAVLVTAADTAVRKLAAASGVDVPPAGGGSSSSSMTVVLIVVALVGVLLLAVGGAFFARRRLKTA